MQRRTWVRPSTLEKQGATRAHDSVVRSKCKQTQRAVVRRARKKGRCPGQGELRHDSDRDRIQEGRGQRLDEVDSAGGKVLVLRKADQVPVRHRFGRVAFVVIRRVIGATRMIVLTSEAWSAEWFATESVLSFTSLKECRCPPWSPCS